MESRRSRDPRILAALIATIVVSATSGCASESPELDAAFVATEAAPLSVLTSSASTASDASGEDAHGRHAAAGIGCAACHACAGVFAFGSVTYPGGATTADGSMTRADGTTTCTVACHFPLGAEPRPVAWNAGALQCTSCHTNVTVDASAPIRSSHLVDDAASSQTCESCHDQSQHLSGQVRLRTDAGTIATGCVECHDGDGQALGGRTPPLLVGWSDTVSGDFHGERPGTCRFDRLDAAGQRFTGKGALPCPADQPDVPNALRITSRWWYVSGLAGPWSWTCDVETVDASGNRIGSTRTRQPCPEGTFLNSACNNPNVPDPDCRPQTLVTRGFGGTLRAPFARSQEALPCAACHDFHASTNDFLLAARVNDVAIPPGTIDRAGVGAQALCNACHAGDRHEVCRSCHKEVWTSDGEYSWFEGEPVDPAPDGSACFSCHGHEGIRLMRDPSPAWPDGHPFSTSQSGSEDACSHCHGAWAPPPLEYTGPRFFPTAPSVSGVTATTATISWATNERATSFVEYGVGAPGRVAGDDAFATAHAVTLTGLTPGTTYVWRVRTSDVFRNVTVTALQTFTTPGATAVPWPDLAPVWVNAEVGTFTATTALVWYPVTAPSGTAVEYEVQLASDPSFTFLVDGSIDGPGVPGSSVGGSGWIGGTPTTVGGKPALSTPATVTNLPQDWCFEIVPNVYYWRVRARDQQGSVSDWSATGSFGAFAFDPWC
jgi:predicted CXXCH cytochrome family protein